jgi:molybdopterin/thiamine biosynthesis adenylyltransferase
MAVTQLNVGRHYELFDPYKFNTPITIIGAGATGSWLAMMLAKLGIVDVTVYDFDKVEEHNVPNQAFDLRFIGEPKVEALFDMVNNSTGTALNVKNEPFRTGRLHGVVFLMVDSMSERKRIWESCIKYKNNVKLLVEPRMGLDGCRVYNVDPMNPTHIKRYEDTYYKDEDAQELSACGNSMTVVTSAVATASWCARQLIEWSNQEQLDNEILIDFKYNNIFPFRW